MKINYISAAYFSDVDVSFLSELKLYAEIDYFVFTGNDVRGSAIMVDSKLKPGIYCATQFEQLNYLSFFLDLNHTFIVHRSNKKHSFLRNFLISLKLCVKIIKIRPDVVHLTFALRHFEWPLYLFRKKMILTVHDPIEHSSTSSRLKRMYRKIAFRLNNRFIIFNQLQKEAFVKQNNLQKAQVYNSKLSTYSFLTLLKPSPYILSLIKGKKYILFFGSITRYKGVDLLLSAMKLVHNRLPDLNLIVAGYGDFYFNIDEYKSLHYIHIINRFIENDELSTLINNTYFTICPYRDATQSGVIMSSFAFCKPVIATKVGGLSEMVIDGHNGILIPPNNVNEIANAIINLYETPNMIKEMSENIFIDYERGDNSWKAIVGKMWEDCYSKL